MSCRSPEVSAEIQQIAVTWTWYAGSWGNGGNALGRGHSIWISMDQYGTFGFGRSVHSLRCSKNPSMKGAVIYFWALVYSKQNPHLLSKSISPGFIPPKLSTCNQMGSTILFPCLFIDWMFLHINCIMLDDHIIGPWISYDFIIFHVFSHLFPPKKPAAWLWGAPHFHKMDVQRPVSRL